MKFCKIKVCEWNYSKKIKGFYKFSWNHWLIAKYSSINDTLMHKQLTFSVLLQLFPPTTVDKLPWIYLYHGDFSNVCRFHATVFACNCFRVNCWCVMVFVKLEYEFFTFLLVSVHYFAKFEISTLKCSNKKCTIWLK